MSVEETTENIEPLGDMDTLEDMDTFQETNSNGNNELDGLEPMESTQNTQISNSGMEEDMDNDEEEGGINENPLNPPILNPNELLSNITNSLFLFEQGASMNNNPIFNHIFNNLVNEINANYEEERQLDEALQESFNSYNQLERNDSQSLSKIPCKYATLDPQIKNDQKTCSICTDKFYYNQDVIKTDCCNNCFHFKCLNEWVKYKNDCPTCREKFE